MNAFEKARRERGPRRVWKRLGALLLATCGVAASLDVARAGDWPQWRGPNRNGLSDEVIVPWKKFPKADWERPTTSGSSAPIVAGDVVFIHATVADKDEEQVVAVDALTGKDLWSDVYPRAEYRSQLGVGPRATPSVIDGKLFTMGIVGTLSCYEAKSGKRLWQINPWEALKVPLPTFAVCASPVVAGDRVIVPVGGEGASIVAYDVATGNEVWRALDEPAASASPIVVARGAGDEKRLEVVVQTTLRVAGLDPKSGELLWDHPLVFQPNGVSPTPMAIDDFLLCTTQDTGTLVLKLSAASERSGPHLEWWKQEMTSYFSSGSLNGKGRAFVVTNQIAPLPRADVRCVDLKTGEERWTKKGLGYFHVGLISLADGKLLVLDDAGNLALATVDDEKYREVARASVCGGTFCSPAFSNGRLVVRDAGRVVCFDLNNAEPKDAEGTTK